PIAPRIHLRSYKRGNKLFIRGIQRPYTRLMPAHETKSADTVLAEETGDPVEKFSADDKPVPELDELESVPEAER
ncbi:hypothetical protein, partial [Halorubrum sp. Ea8]|uniref:hypothetical protein n=1 Tax=Halorubrum sp. Ea8 TaxID=1383841 RepID=UPI001C3CC4D7